MRLVWVVIPLVLVVSIIGIVGMQESFAEDFSFNTGKTVIPRSSNIDSPKVQFEKGIERHEVICTAGLYLIYKVSDGSPVCVEEYGAAPKLIERGWATLGETSLTFTIDKEVYSLGEKIIITMKNDGETMIKFNGFPYFQIYDESGNNIELPLDTIVPPTENISYFDTFSSVSFIWNQTNRNLESVNPGVYTVSAKYYYPIPNGDTGEMGMQQKITTKTFEIIDETKSNLEPIDITNVIDGNNQFAIDFYSKVSQESDENIFFSPWSISTAAAIVYEGARGNTADEMQQVFGFSSDDTTRQSEFHYANYLLNQKSSEYRLDVANALWLQEGFTPHKEYVDIVHNYYDSTVDTVDFTTNGVDIINEWVTQKTQEKIKELFPPGPRPDTKLAITNAIYFNGTWVNPFDAERTEDAPFWITPDQSVDVPMMNLRTTFLNSTLTENLQILQLPYKGDKLSMLILLPNEKDGLTSLETTLSAENLIEWQNSLRMSKVVVFMPKFELETDYSLTPILQNLGMIDAFSAADFSGISNSGLFIDEAVHKAFVNVNEKGTEAAAATGFTMAESAPMPIKIDHPFVFLIQDDTTGNILFIGRVTNPSE